MLSLHPGPVTNPCIVCSKSVWANQQGVSCDSCEMWTHVNCCGIDKEDYQRLQSMEKFSWKCPSCLFAELPYADHELSMVLISHFSVSLTPPWLSHLYTVIPTVKVWWTRWMNWDPSSPVWRGLYFLELVRRGWTVPSVMLKLPFHLMTYIDEIADAVVGKY